MLCDCDITVGCQAHFSIVAGFHHSDLRLANVMEILQHNEASATASTLNGAIPEQKADSEKPAAIRLTGENILEEHCYFDNVDGKVTLHALPNSVTVCFVHTTSVDDSIFSLVFERQANRC